MGKLRKSENRVRVAHLERKVKASHPVLIITAIEYHNINTLKMYAQA